MKKEQYDVIALGELLIDFTQSAANEASIPSFDCNPGGAPANVLTMCSHMGLKTGFIGKVGLDMFGELLKKTLEDENIDTKGLVEDPETFTTLAFVKLSDKGERSFSFARKPGADTQLSVDDLDTAMLESCKIFHMGSLSLTDLPAREASMTALRLAKDAGAIISYDPNYRAPLWNSVDEAVAQMKKPLEYADIVKVSDEEALLLTGIEDVEKAATAILESGVQVVFVTLGEKGALVKCKDGSSFVPAIKAKTVDTTGAGDAFLGGVLSYIVKSRQVIKAMTISDFVKAAELGCKVAGLCVEKRGGIPAMPRFD